MSLTPITHTDGQFYFIQSCNQHVDTKTQWLNWATVVEVKGAINSFLYIVNMLAFIYLIALTVRFFRIAIMFQMNAVLQSINVTAALGCGP